MVTNRFATCVRTAVPLTSLALALLAGIRAAEAQPGRSTYSAGPAERQAGGELPFSNSVYRRPTVSPYLNLQQQGYNPLQSQNIYQTVVQPQVQQQQQQIEQLSQRRQMQKLQNQVQQIGRDTTGRQVDESIRPTGHRATYMNYSHYYQ
jgi:TolA-binding protein